MINYRFRNGTYISLWVFFFILLLLSLCVRTIVNFSVLQVMNDRTTRRMSNIANCIRMVRREVVEAIIKNSMLTHLVLKSIRLGLFRLHVAFTARTRARSRFKKPGSLGTNFTFELFASLRILHTV